jgi:lipopolysaccharide biosynthesis glycosyltransferase
MSEIINVALCLNNNYTMPACVLLTSVQLTNKDLYFHFYILYNDIGDNNKKHLQNCIKTNAELFFCKIDIDFYKIFLTSYKKDFEYISIEAYFRIFLPSVLPNSINKILYLDGDIICCDSLKELWNINIDNYAAGVIPDEDGQKVTIFNKLRLDFKGFYFNSGVMLINLEYWRIYNIQNKILKYIETNKEKCFFDQDALNYILFDQVVYLNFKYNVMLCHTSKNVFIENKYYDERIAALKKPCFIHFITSLKPWFYECYNPYASLWDFFYSKTEYKNKNKKYLYKGKKHIKWLIKKVIGKEDVRSHQYDDYQIIFSRVIEEIINNYN